MPGNEFGDSVHNFFAQDSLAQVQHNSPVADANWPTSRGNMWAGSQRQIGVLSPNTKNHNMQNSDTGRGLSSYPFNGQHGLSFTQPIPRPEFAKSQSQSQQPNLNGYMYGNQFYQTRQDETNIPAVDTSSDQCNIASGGSSFFESQQWLGPEQHTRVSVRSEPSDSPVGGDLFGGQQISHQQSNMLHSLQRQQFGINDVQQFQQQVMFMKMQELHRQQQLHQLEASQQNTLNQVSSCPKVASGVRSSALVNGTADSGALIHSWANELGNTNWSQRGSPLQGSSSGLIPSNNGQAQCLMGLSPQQIDQSLYGVPVSNSRPFLNQFSQGMTDKQAVQPMPTFNSSFTVNQYAPLSDQVSGQDGVFLSRQRLQVENVFGDVSNHALSNAMDVGNLQQADTMQKASALQEFRGRQDIAVPSEISQEEAAAGASSSQNEVGLDPTEERILFGSDDSIWAAFGKSPMSGEGGNSFDGGELLDGTPSIQGGTWSALMQSAVAETSSSDVGLQEQWTGLNFHSTQILSGSPNLTYNSERHKATYAEDNLPQASSVNSVSVHPSGSPDMRNGYRNVQGHRFPFEPGKSLQSNSPQRLVQSSDERNKWSKLGQSQMLGAEGCQMVERTSNPLDREMISKNISSPLAPELGGAREQYNNSAGWSVLESAMPSGDAVSVSRENSLKLSQDYNQKKFIQGEVVHRGAGWNSNPGRNTTVTNAHTESSVGSPQANSVVFSLHNSAAIPSSSAMRSSEETGQFFQNNHQSSYWKNADPLIKSSVSKGEVLQHHVSEDNQLLHSSLDIGDKEGKMHEMENNDKQENSNDSHRSNLSPLSSAGGVRENVLSDARDSRFLPTGKHKLSNEVGRRNFWANKFQYYPMGNVDKEADPTCGMEHLTHSQPMLQQNAHHGQSLLAQAPIIQAELEKVRSSDELTDGNGQVHSGGSFPDGGSNMSTLINRSIGLSPDTDPRSSPDMLQLLQKVDPSRESGSMDQFSNYEHKISSDVPEAGNADGSSGHLGRSQSSASQGFGLQLGPPTQQIAVQTHLLSSLGPTGAVSSSHSSHAASEIRERSRGQMPHPHQAQSLPAPSDLLQQELKHNTSRVPGSTINETDMHAMSGNFSSAFELAFGHSYSKNHLQNTHMGRASGQDSTNQSIGLCFDEHAPHSTEKGDSGRGPLPDGAGNIPYSPALKMGNSQLSNANGPHGSVANNRASSKEQVSASSSFLMPGISLQAASSKKFTNMHTNFPSSPHLFSSKYSKDPSYIPQPNQLNIMESSLSAPERQGDQDVNKGGTLMSELGSSSVNSLHSVEGEELREKESTSEPVPMENMDLVQEMNNSHGRESIVKNIDEGSPANSASMQRDIEAFGRSLKPNSFPNQSYSLLNQMWTMKNAETDPSNMVLKRMRVPDSSAATQQVPSGDSRMPNFSGPDDLQRSVSFQHGGRMSPQDVAFCQDASQTGFHNSNTGSVEPEQTKISPHMAPSWFNQYGSLKNRQMLQMYDSHRAAAMNTAEQPLTPAMSTSGLYAFNSIQQVNHATADRSQIGNLGRSSIANFAGAEHYSSLQTLPMNVDQRHPIMKPKKRKRATSEITPWYKEISLDLWSDQTISLANIEWAKAVNKLTEKVKEIDSIDDGPPRLKARRRLMLTTQLMQQLFYPPPAAILSADAKLEYDSVAYSISRLALGDACSMVSCSDADTNMPHDGKELLLDKCNTSERTDKHHFARAVEELMGRARKLESDFVSLDRRASVLDVIVEGQDLEKFSVFYRFVKFHGGGQSSGSESFSTDAVAHTHKPFLQRYVTALPMPKNLPDRLQCLSL